MPRGLLLAIAILVLSCGRAFGDTAGPSTAGTASGTNWTFDLTSLQVSAATSDDNRVSYNSTAQDDLILTNFGFSLPASATIDGITVTREGSGNSGSPSIRRYRIGLTKDASTLAGTRKTALDLPASTDDSANVGGTTDTWGTTWTASEINSSNFGLLVSDNDTSANTIGFDRFEVTITFTTPPTTWDGSTDTDWFDATNWSAGVPSSGAATTIPSSLTNYPVLDATGAACLSLTIQSGASLDLDTFQIDVYGDLDPQATGVISAAATGRIRFAGSTQQTVLNPFTFAGDLEVDSTNTVRLREDLSFNDLIVTDGTATLANGGTSYTHTISGDVTLASGASLNFGASDVDIAGDFTISGSLTTASLLNSNQINIAGNVTETGSIIWLGDTTWIFDGGGTSVVDVTTSGVYDFDNMTVTNNTTVRIDSDVRIQDTITINAGSVLDCDGDIDFNGSLVFSGAGRLQVGSTVTSIGGSFTASTGTVEFDDTTADRTISNLAYFNLEVDTSTRTASLPGAISPTGALTVSSGTLSVAANTLTVTGATDVNGTLSLSTGTIDANGAFDATGGSVTFTGAGRLQLGGAVTSLGTLTASTGTVEYDDTAANQTVGAVTYTNLEIDNSTRVALTGGNVTVTDTLTITTGELEVDDADTLQADGTTSVTGTLDLEPGAVLQLANAQTLTVNSGGTFEALGSATDLALITSTGANRYSFSVAAGGIMRANYAYFRHMDANGIQITDNGTVQALTQLDNCVFSDGTSSGRFLKITNNDNAVTLASLLFDDSPTDLSFNVETVSATATITIDPYGGDLGGAASENDNGGGTVTPGFIVWSNQTPVRLRSFEAVPEIGGVRLDWQTDAEWRSAGFVIEREGAGGTTIDPDADRRVGPPLILATGMSPGGDTYSFLDDTTLPGAIYTYRLIEVDIAAFRRKLAVTAPCGITSMGSSSRRGSSQRSGVVPMTTPLLALPSVAQSSVPLPISTNSASQPGSGVVKILVEQSGVTRVPHSALLSAAFPVGGSVDRFCLRRDGVAIPLRVVGGEDGRFEPGDSIDFVALPFESLETRFDVYWLDLANPGNPAPRIPRLDGSTATIPSRPSVAPYDWILEVDAQYVPSLIDGEGRDHWFWATLVTGSSVDVAIDVDALATSQAAQGQLEIELEGWSENLLSAIDHFVEVSLNGVDLGELVSNGRGPYGASFEIPTGVLVEGQNTLTIAAGVPASAGPDWFSVSLLDRVTVRAPREHSVVANRLSFEVETLAPQRLDGFTEPEISLYQVSGPGAPRVVVNTAVVGQGTEWSLAFRPTALGARFEAFTNPGARSPAAVVPTDHPMTPDPLQSIDLVIVVPRALRPAIEPLAEYRRACGRKVEVVTLESIFDQFGGGRPTTDALRGFLEHAWLEWPAPGLESALLVGDATCDPRGNLGPSPRQVLPTRLIETRELQTASDDWFVDLAGKDGVPELCIGRLPVANLEECARLVEKIIEVELGCGAGRNGQRVLLVSDDDPEFARANDAIERILSVNHVIERIDLGFGSLLDPQAALFDAWEAETMLVHYSGHGSRIGWSASALLEVGDLPAVVAPCASPIVVAMNCLNGYFIHAASPSLGEALLLEEGAGCVAYWGPSALTTHLPQSALAGRFYRHLEASAGTLGRAIRAAKADLAGAGMRSVRETWILLGDPELRIP